MKNDKMALLGGALRGLRLPEDSAPAKQGSLAVIDDYLCAHRGDEWEQVLRLAAPALEKFLQERGAIVYSHMKDNAANNTLTNSLGPAGRLVGPGPTSQVAVNTNTKFNATAGCTRIVNDARAEFVLSQPLPTNADYAIGCIYRPNATVATGYNSSVISLYTANLTTQQQTAATHTASNGKYATSYKSGTSSSRTFQLTRDEWNVVILSRNGDMLRQRCFVPRLNTSDSSSGVTTAVSTSEATRFVIGQSVSNYPDKSIIGDIKEVFMIPKGLTEEEMITLQGLMAAVA